MIGPRMGILFANPETFGATSLKIGNTILAAFPNNLATNPPTLVAANFVPTELATLLRTPEVADSPLPMS